MFVTTADLVHQKYDVLKVVFAHGNSTDGIFKTANPLEAYSKVHDMLKEEADKLNADAIVGAHFDYRVATKSGCSSGQAFEVFAYGTAVKFS